MMKNSQDDAFKIKPQHFSYIKSQMEILTQSVLKITEGPNQMIALLGGTGSGKSTIISILLGAKLKFQKASLGEWKIDHNDTTGKYPKIGHENQSCTTVPVAFLTNSKTYIDLAGWFDTRTPIQQILNAISTSQVFTPRKQLKILIVVSSSQYKALRGGVLINVANRLMECFKEDFLHIVHSIILIMTKVDTDDWEIEDVKKQLIKICKKNQNLKGHTKHFLQILVKEQRILFLPIPKKNQEFKKHVQYIQKQIQQVRWSTLINQAQISLSTEAKLAVNDCILDLNKDLNNTAQKIGSQIQKQCGKKKFKNGKQANDALNQLILSNQILMKQISQVLTFKQLEQKLDQLVKRLPVNKLIAGELKKNFNMINFYKQISTETKISQDFMKIISVSLQKSILKVQKDRDNLASKQQIQQMKKDFLIEMDKRAKQEKKQRQKVQSQLQNKMKEQQDKIIKQKEEHDKQMNQLEPKLRKQLQDQIKNQRMKAQELQKLNQKKNFWSNFGTVVGTIKMVSDMYSLYKTGQSLNSSFLQKSFDKSSNLNQPISSKFMQTFVKQSTKKFQELKKLK